MIPTLLMVVDSLPARAVPVPDLWGQAATPSTPATGSALSQQMDGNEATLTSDPTDRTARRREVEAADAWALEEIRAGRPEHAMEILERGIEHVPNDPDLLLNFGLEATALKQFGIAEQALGAADHLRPNDPKTTYALGRLAFEQSHMPDAERYLSAYLKLKPDDASAWFGVGRVYAAEQHTEQAQAAFERSVALQPRQSESYYQLGQIALEAHQDDVARANFGKVLARVPNHAGALTGMGQAELRAKQYAAAEASLRAAEAADPNYPAPHYFRGLALAHLGRKEEAAAELQRGDSRVHATGPANGSATGTATQPPVAAPNPQP